MTAHGGKLYLALASMLALAMLAQGCGRESLADSVKQAKARESENASLLTASYNQIAGSYHDSGANPSYAVSANFQVIPVQRDGFVTPQPSISGSFTVVDRVHPLADGETSPSLAFSNGTYDDASRHFAARISGINSPGIDVSCTLRENEPVLDCQWIPIGSTTGFSFTMVRN